MNRRAAEIAIAAACSVALAVVGPLRPFVLCLTAGGLTGLVVALFYS